MKKPILIFICSCLLFHLAKAQVVDDSLLSTTRLNIAVPEIPAFKALGIEPSNILRPSDIKSIALMISDFHGDAGFMIPKSFAAEVAPVMLASPAVSMNEYRNNRWFRFIYKTRVSLGTTNDDENSQVRYMSGGLRFAIIDKGDFKMDTVFLKENIYEALDDSAKLLENTKREYMRRYNKGPMDVDRNSSEYKAVLDSIYKKEKIRSVALIDGAIKNYKKLNWNAQRLEVAYAVTGASPDSLISGLAVSRHNVWLVFAQPLGKKNHWGQLLLGVNFSTEKVNYKFYNTFDIPLRIYAGTNRVKAFAELEYRNSTLTGYEQSMLINFGGEINIIDGIWINFSGGIDNAFIGEGKAQFVSNLKFNFTLPEKFKLN
ncbi:MAG: hypothetical protein ABI723_09905 [Bacteroidia bacterium]